MQGLGADLVCSGFCHGARFVERLVTYLCTWTLELLIVRPVCSIPYVSAEEIGMTVDAHKILGFAFIFGRWW
jgi:hypothetical protein